MNLEYLKTYQTLIQLGSFSAAARELSISQPAVSFQIQKLEHDLGIRLINRNLKKISITKAGRRVLEFAETINGEESDLMKDIGNMRKEVMGELFIAASTILGEYILPDLVGAFIEAHPAVKAHVAIEDSTAVISSVKDGIVEVGFCGTVPPKGQGLESFRIADDEIVLIVPRKHRFANHKHISFSGLKEETFIFREATSGTQKSVESLLVKTGFSASQLTPRLILGSSQAIVSAVEKNAGIAFVSNLAIEKSLKAGTIKQVGLNGVNMKRNFYCLYYTERLEIKLIEEFVKFIRLKASIDKAAAL
jgi:DNA-binding transcriptional LysR family regulator